MKMVKIFAFLFILFFIPAYSLSSSLEFIQISLMDGDVQIRTEETGEWVPASINIPLKEKDQIWVPEGGRTELRLKGGTALRLDEKSALSILTLDQMTFQFYLQEGRGYVNFKGKRDSFVQIDTPISSIRCYERSAFGIDVSGNGYTDITVYEGTVYVETRDGQTRVNAGNALSLGDGGYADLYPLGSADEWEKWNRERDRRYMVMAPPSRYLPDELDDYSGELTENGSWMSDSEYGYVWAPHIISSPNWAPYRAGRWVWIGGDYIWISYEPWGWVPYHYGRWVFLRGRGWCWVPPRRGEVYWGPGFVGWVHTPTYVSWVPLAPGEIYYGHGYYGPHSVNITNINIRNIQINQIAYRNIHVHNAVTVIHRNTFITGRHVGIQVRENPFLKERISVGRPDIRPQVATMRPVIKEIPRAKLPPRQISEIRASQIKTKRPVVMEKNISVLKPGTAPREMVIRPKESRPIDRRIEKPVDRRPVEREEVKTIEKRTIERDTIKPEKKKPLERRPVEKSVGKPEEKKPLERRPVERTEPRKEIERPAREIQTPERSKETKPAEPKSSREIRPPEKAIEKPLEKRPIERQIQTPKEQRPSQITPPERTSVPKTQERQIERPAQKPPERPTVQSPPERSQPQRPVERQIERPIQQAPPPKAMERPEVQRPVERTVPQRPVDKGENNRGQK